MIVSSSSFDKNNIFLMLSVFLEKTDVVLGKTCFANLSPNILTIFENSCFATTASYMLRRGESPLPTDIKR